jgi:hypothetical protein
MSSSPRNVKPASSAGRSVRTAEPGAPGAAHGILSLTLSSSDRDRMNELAAKARDGSLGADEQLEIESYRQACRLLDLMKALKRAGETAA